MSKLRSIHVVGRAFRASSSKWNRRRGLCGILPWNFSTGLPAIAAATVARVQSPLRWALAWCSTEQVRQLTLPLTAISTRRRGILLILLLVLLLILLLGLIH